MNKGHLSEHFDGVGMKMLTRVDATRYSNQHEVGDGQNGRVLMRILGDQPRKGANRFPARYIWLSDEQEAITDEGFLSWYDSRENQSHRTPEWRLYYQTNAVTDLMDEGDHLFVARMHDDPLLFIVVPGGSAIAGQVAWLFGLDAQREFEGFAINDFEGLDDTRMDFISRFILDEIGIEFEDPDSNSLDTIIERFGMSFPGTAEFSALARLTLPKVEAQDDPDAALMAWLDHEQAMFRRLEKRIVGERVAKGFGDAQSVDVDDFIRYSLEVHNRRKSRMGQSFQNQLKAVFDAFGLRYSAQVKTEKGKKPDFIFPGKQEYNNQDFNVSLLTMLAAKSTCKDRWSQILPEAEKIEQKHLVTLEPSITPAQTTMMKVSNVQLIVPRGIHSSYNLDQRSWLMDIRGFVELVSERQNQT